MDSCTAQSLLKVRRLLIAFLSGLLACSYSRNDDREQAPADPAIRSVYHRRLTIHEVTSSWIGTVREVTASAYHATVRTEALWMRNYEAPPQEYVPSAAPYKISNASTSTPLSETQEAVLQLIKALLTRDMKGTPIVAVAVSNFRTGAFVVVRDQPLTIARIRELLDLLDVQPGADVPEVSCKALNAGSLPNQIAETRRALTHSTNATKRGEALTAIANLRMEIERLRARTARP